ncbi:hypothetical protein GCM10007880_16880 [Mesorhizobium amorphae]|uniref:Uncharacterized protein n=1 Tax=Mesorhizobium amorphae CCNWGS0123 TaxID=1082933 RepID=G6YDG4_9HYPH|nr:hypothetical protein MEA186_20007 [Mesorhizobium amorphae CCNWGS0123]GLR41172.1 hypothetical protein GCM10007880_16880 [Mesorhizobium amorphae]
MGPAIEGIGALSSFDLSEFLDDCNALGISKAGHRGALCLDAKT